MAKKDDVNLLLSLVNRKVHPDNLRDDVLERVVDLDTDDPGILSADWRRVLEGRRAKAEHRAALEVEALEDPDQPLMDSLVASGDDD